jgi:hypothetical protein
VVPLPGMDLDGEVGMNSRDRIRGLLRRMRRRRSRVGGLGGVVRRVQVRVRVVRDGRGIGMRRVLGVRIRVLGLVVREGDEFR